MKKFECKSGAANCPALEDQSMEFCTSCGEWLGLSLQDLEKENSIQEDEIRRTTRAVSYTHLTLPTKRIV